MNILIIGGGNFMGSALLDVLLEQRERFNVTVVSRDRRHWNERVSARPHVTHVKADRRDKYELLHALSAHCADEAKRPRFCIDFCAYDVDDVEPLVSFLRDLSCHYVFVSTDSVYEVCDTERDVPRLESHAVRPASESERAQLRRCDQYGDDKLQCEEWLQAHAGLAWTALRLPDVFGPRDGTKRHWCYQLLVKLQDERPVQLTAKERRRKLSFVFSRDVARAVLGVIERPAAAANQSFNLACVEAVTLEQYLELVAAALGKATLRVAELPADVDNELQFLPSVSERAGVLDVAKAQRALAFAPTPLRAAVRETVAWHERAWHEHRGERPELEELDARWHARLGELYGE